MSHENLPMVLLQTFNSKSIVKRGGKIVSTFSLFEEVYLFNVLSNLFGCLMHKLIKLFITTKKIFSCFFYYPFFEKKIAIFSEICEDLKSHFLHLNQKLVAFHLGFCKIGEK